ncbi:3-oxoacyl-reductase [Podospora aff. communis PSN243]|uniref:3-oxoacyl-reductase n=1 Tax=Podospora aff. communis PSN243 TaxID=3040156 RepID=A0AAV9H079_9PEZI|nr:3-oxoacyl-reductase [Podospora aff. communis PSN243]
MSFLRLQRHRVFLHLPALWSPTVQVRSTRSFSHTTPLPRTAIVTGAGRGIGRAIAIALARDGYDITVNDIASQQSQIDSTVSAIQSLGRRAHGHAADVGSASAVDELVASSVAALGPLNAMVANAGVINVKPMLELDDEDWERVLRVNVVGVHNSFRAAARHMVEVGTKGKLIAASSVGGFKPWKGLGHYVTTKWAVRGLTQMWALEMAEHGITANAYAPGFVDTQMWDDISAGMGSTKSEVLTAFQPMIALGRTARTEDVAQVVSYLASEKADYVTGQTLVVDGGVVYT